jgi:hypothetical protein
MGRAQRSRRTGFTTDGLTVEGSAWDGLQASTACLTAIPGRTWWSACRAIPGPTRSPGRADIVEDHAWSIVLSETMSINVWVQQQ